MAGARRIMAASSSSASATNCVGESTSARASASQPGAPARRPGAARSDPAAPAPATAPASCGGGRTRRAPASRRGRRRRGRAAQPEQRRVHPRPGPEHGAVDGAQHPHVAGELHERRSASRRCATPGRRPQPVGDLALHHHRPGRRPPAARRSCAGSAASRSSTAGWRPSRVGAGSSPAEVDPHRVAPDQLDVALLGGDRLRARARASGRARSRARVADSGASRSVSAPSPPPTSSTTSSGPTSAARTIASSRFGSARKFWPRRSTIGSDTAGRRSPRPALQRGVGDPARLRHPLGRRDHVGGLVRAPADAAAGEERRVGLDQQQLVGNSAAASRRCSAFGIGDVAGERAVPAALGSLGGALGRRREAVQDHADPGRPRRASISKVWSSAAPSVVVAVSRTWITSGLSTRRAISIWARNARR